MAWSRSGSIGRCNPAVKGGEFGWCRVGGDGDQWHGIPRLGLADAARQFPAIHAFHTDIEQHEVWQVGFLPGCQSCKRIFSGRGMTGSAAHGFEQFGNDQLVRGIVIDNQSGKAETFL